MENTNPDTYQSMATRPRTLPNVMSRSQQNQHSVQARTGLREITPTRKKGSRSLVKVYDTCDVDEFQDDDCDEFGFTKSACSPSDMITVVIKLSDDRVETETLTGEAPQGHGPIDEGNVTELGAVGGGYISRSCSSSDIEYSTNDVPMTERHPINKETLPKRPPRRNRGIKISEECETQSGQGRIKSNSELLSEMTIPDTDIKTNTEMAISLPYVNNIFSDDTSHNVADETPDVSISPRSKTRIVYDSSYTGDQAVTHRTPIVMDPSSVSVEDEGEDFMEYLKGLRKTSLEDDTDYSQNETNDSTEELTIPGRHGGGGNGYHSDQEIAADLTTGDSRNTTSESDEETIIEVTDVADVEQCNANRHSIRDNICSEYHQNDDNEGSKHGDTSEGENSSEEDGDNDDDDAGDDDDSGGGDDDDEEEDDDDDDDDDDGNDDGDEDDDDGNDDGDEDDDDDDWYSGREDDVDSDTDCHTSSDETDDAMEDKDYETHLTPGVRSRSIIDTGAEDGNISEITMVNNDDSNSFTSEHVDIPTITVNEVADTSDDDMYACEGLAIHGTSNDICTESKLNFEIRVTDMTALTNNDEDKLTFDKSDLHESSSNDETTMAATQETKENLSEVTAFECLEHDKLVLSSISNRSDASFNETPNCVSVACEECVTENHIALDIDGDHIETKCVASEVNDLTSQDGNISCQINDLENTASVFTSESNDKEDNLSLYGSSSISTTYADDLSDFESAIDEEFWQNITSSPTISDHFSNSSLDGSIDSDFDTTHERGSVCQNPFYIGESAAEIDDDRLTKGCELGNEEINSTSCMHDTDTDSVETGSVFEDAVQELDIVDDSGDICLDIESTVNNSSCNCSHEACDEKRDPEKDETIDVDCPEIAIRRTVTYNVPYIKPKPISEPMNASKQKVLKYLCRQRIHALKAKGLKSDKNDKQNCSLLEPVSGDMCYKAEDAYEDCKPDVMSAGGNTIKVGNGFIIIDAAANLHLPKGPKLKKYIHKGQGSKGDIPCVYYRGIPSALNNAYTMADLDFPSKHQPSQSDATSHQILHACNRLATKGSQGLISPSQEYSNGMMQDEDFSQADDNASTTSSELNDLLANARDLLNLSQFDDAESTFLKLYQQIQEKPEDSSNLLVETLMGLADICIRRSRMCRSNPLEWQWLCMHAIALLQYTSEFCDSELEADLDNQQTDWFQEQKQASELKCRPLEDAFIRALYNCLNHDANYYNPFQSFSLPTTPTNHNKRTNLFPLNSTMPQYLVVPGMRYRITDQGFKKQSADDSNVTVDWLAKFQHYCKDRLQTKDSKVVTVKILKSTVVSRADDDTETVVSVGSHGSLDWDNGDLQGLEELTEDVIDDESPVKEYSFAFELASGNADNDGWKFFLNDRRNYRFRNVLEVKHDDNSKEIDEENERESKELGDTLQKERRHIRVEKDIISPLHEHSIKLTLSRSYCRLAEKLVQEEEYGKAEIVYEKILDIIEDIQDGTAGMLKFSARILKNLGTVKSKLGKASSGLLLLNKALGTYRDLQDEEANFEIAVALIELGNGHIVGKNNENSVFDDVIVAICDFFEKDASDTESTSSSGSTSQMTSSVMTSSLKSELEERNVEEAIMCFSEAMSLLDRFEADEEQADMFARAVMRLGDCYFMQKDYDRALDCYEKTISMFRSNKVTGKYSLMENAHVLCMLAVSSFMLHVYPRAASVFEMALHIVKCSYGFTRTFLVGMLQSLCGITYYKMKNYHKCVSMCYQSYDTYKEIFGDDMSRLDRQKFWLVCQTLYVMGNSYNILNLQQRAMKYLTIARSLMKSSKCRQRRQFMRVLQILGDSYFALYDYKGALQYYNEALEYGECESQVSFDEQFDSNCASDEMTIHNHLVSKSAEAHLSMQQYQNAVHYLEQAHDMQEVMGEDIKEDLIATLNQLGQMHSVSGDIDKAIESYKESMEVFREIHNGKLGPEMCSTLGNLAAICYVKACMSDDVDQELNMMVAAEQYFTEALKMQANPEICVKYATFLYSQFNFHNAIMYLNDALNVNLITSDIVYRGLEKVTLPDLLQDEVDTQEEICLPTTCLARYLQVLSHKSLGHLRVAEEHLLSLMEEVIDYDIPLLHSLLGYAMMELSLFDQAAACFYTATVTEENYQLASENYCICLLILTLETLQNAFENIWYYYRKQHNNYFKRQ